MSDTSTVLYDVSDGVATITLNRPQVYNAFNGQLHADLIAALREAAADDAVRAVVLTGAGKAFCSGQDLKAISMADIADIGRALRDQYNPLIRTMRTMRKPLIGAVNGVAAGAGFSLALACDMRVAAEDTRFVAAFVNIGLVPDSGMTYILPRIVGHARAFEICTLGEPVSAATALSYGLVNRVVPAAELLPAATALAQRLANGPALAIGLIKAGLDMSQNATLDEVLDFESASQQTVGGHTEYVEGVSAFLEKRPPRFRQ